MGNWAIVVENRDSHRLKVWLLYLAFGPGRVSA